MATITDESHASRHSLQKPLSLPPAAILSQEESPQRADIIVPLELSITILFNPMYILTPSFDSPYVQQVLRTCSSLSLTAISDTIDRIIHTKVMDVANIMIDLRLSSKYCVPSFPIWTQKVENSKASLKYSEWKQGGYGVYMVMDLYGKHPTCCLLCKYY